jgi:hypothetical protein
MAKNKSLKERLLDEFAMFAEENAKVVLNKSNITHEIKTEKDLDEECSKLRPSYSNHSREEILEELLLTKVGLKIFQEDLRIESAKVNTLLTQHVEGLNKRIANNENRQVKTDKFAPNIRKQQIAEKIIQEMKIRLKKLQPADSKEFYKLMNAGCSREGLSKPSKTTLSNYFKKYTGLSSTK